MVLQVCVSITVITLQYSHGDQNLLSVEPVCWFSTGKHSVPLRKALCQFNSIRQCTATQLKQALIMAK